MTTGKITEALLAPWDGKTVYLYMVSQETCREPIYRWWQGWLNFGVHQVEDIDGHWGGFTFHWKGPRLIRQWSDGGWVKSFNPKRTRHVEVEVDDPRGSVITVKGTKLNLAPVVWGDPWPENGIGSQALPPGSYTKIRVRDGNGTLLWEAGLTGKVCIEEENDSLRLTTGDVTFSVSS